MEASWHALLLLEDLALTGAWRPAMKTAARVGECSQQILLRDAFAVRGVRPLASDVRPMGRRSTGRKGRKDDSQSSGALSGTVSEAQQGRTDMLQHDL